jgi:serine/threonine protein phosphatase PrpC
MGQRPRAYAGAHATGRVGSEELATTSGSRFGHTVRTDVGLVRAVNEDAAYSDDHVLVVADGVGGGPAGEVASALAVAPFGRLRHDADSDVVDRLRDAALRGNDAIAQHIDTNPHQAGMATTLTALLLDGDQLGLLHAGDSRAYLFRDGALYQLSHDDTLVQSLVEGGLLSERDARSHPHRHIVTRSLMGREPRFSLANFHVSEGDRVLACSDGVTDAVSDEELADVLGEPIRERCAEEVIATALRNGTADNVTCIVGDVLATS